jgi:predicted enzyme related to lactoylglutathione lyase
MASHRVVHFEIPADQPEALVKFYTDLFGWKIHKAPIPGFEYWPCETGDGPGINGAIMKRAAPAQTVCNYVTVEQIDALIDKARSLGATIVVPKSPVAGMGWFAVAIDPQGNPFGFWQNDSAAG